MTACKIIIFLLLFSALTGMLYCLAAGDVLHRAVTHARGALRTAALEGERAAKRRTSEPEIRKKGIARGMDRMRKLYVYSRIGSGTGLSFEIWLVCILASAAAVYFFVMLTGHALRVGLAAILRDLALFYALQKFCAYRNYRKTDAELIQMVDLLSNFSVTSGEITDIFHQISRYLSDPLRSVLEECYYDAGTGGNTPLALYAMADKIEHPMFKDLIRNIEICINYTADFGVIVSNSRKVFLDAQRARKQRQAMAHENLIDMAVVSAGMFASLVITDTLGTGIWDILLQTTPGHVCIAVTVFIYTVFGVSVVSAGR